MVGPGSQRVAAVTVIVPTYERPDFLANALDSALAQTFTDFELLVGDNSETDATEKLVASYDDPRICYHRNRPGLGAQGNWLDLVERSSSPLIASLHDDDVWHPDFLATVVPPMVADPDVAMTFTDFWLIDHEGHRLDDLTEEESARTRRNQLDSGPVDYDLDVGLRLVAVWNAPQPAYAAVIRRADVLACEFPDGIAPLYDIWLSYQLVVKERPLRYERRRLTSYRVHAGSTTSAGFTVPEDEVFRRIVEAHGDHAEIVEEIKEYWATLRWSRATKLMEHCDARTVSQKELTAAAEDLRGLRRMAARTAGSSELAWRGLRWAWARRHRVEATA